MTSYTRLETAINTCSQLTPSISNPNKASLFTFLVPFLKALTTAPFTTGSCGALKPFRNRSSTIPSDIREISAAVSKTGMINFLCLCLFGCEGKRTSYFNSFIDTNLIYSFLYKLHKIKFLYMFRASSAHLQEVNDVNFTCMQPLIFSFCKSELLLYYTWNMLSFC